MISAQHAKQQALEIAQSKANLEIKDISKKIEEAISKGALSCSHSGTISSNVKAQLEGLGYVVKNYSQYNESYYSISWS